VTTDPRSFVLPSGKPDCYRPLLELAACRIEHGGVPAGVMPGHEVAFGAPVV